MASMIGKNVRPGKIGRICNKEGNFTSPELKVVMVVHTAECKFAFVQSTASEGGAPGPIFPVDANSMYIYSD